MAKALFQMRFGGAYVGTSKKTNREYCSLSFLEEVETRNGDVYVNLTKCFSDTVPEGLDEYELYEPVDVVLDVSSDGKSVQFVSMQHHNPKGDK